MSRGRRYLFFRPLRSTFEKQKAASDSMPAHALSMKTHPPVVICNSPACWTRASNKFTSVAMTLLLPRHAGRVFVAAP